MSQIGTQPYNRFLAVTASDTVDLQPFTQEQRLTDAIAVSGAGNVVAVQQNGVAVTIPMAAGETLAIAVRRINATNTTATGISALYTV